MKMNRFAAMGFVLVVTQGTLAHQPTMSDGTAIDPDSAIELDDIQLSRVIYHEITEDAPSLWLTFDVDEPQSLFVSLGLPLLNRLESFRPAFAVLGPGLPAIDLPIEVPEGLGGLVFETDEVLEPEVFDEPFSGTSSWILREEDVDLPEAGTYFIVAFVPSGEAGKLWLAPGDREEFGLGDIIRLSGVLDEVRVFHETSGGAFPCFLFPLAAILMVMPVLGLLGKRKRGRAPGAQGPDEVSPC
jgi:hypothetical protein